MFEQQYHTCPQHWSCTNPFCQNNQENSSDINFHDAQFNSALQGQLPQGNFPFHGQTDDLPATNALTPSSVPLIVPDVSAQSHQLENCTNVDNIGSPQRETTFPQGQITVKSISDKEKLNLFKSQLQDGDAQIVPDSEDLSCGGYVMQDQAASMQIRTRCSTYPGSVKKSSRRRRNRSRVESHASSERGQSVSNCSSTEEQAQTGVRLRSATICSRNSSRWFPPCQRIWRPGPEWRTPALNATEEGAPPASGQSHAQMISILDDFRPRSATFPKRNSRQLPPPIPPRSQIPVVGATEQSIQPAHDYSSPCEENQAQMMPVSAIGTSIQSLPPGQFQEVWKPGHLVCQTPTLNETEQDVPPASNLYSFQTTLGEDQDLPIRITVGVRLENATNHSRSSWQVLRPPLGAQTPANKFTGKRIPPASNLPTEQAILGQNQAQTMSVSADFKPRSASVPVKENQPAAFEQLQPNNLGPANNCPTLTKFQSSIICIFCDSEFEDGTDHFASCIALIGVLRQG